MKRSIGCWETMAHAFKILKEISILTNQQGVRGKIFKRTNTNIKKNYCTGIPALFPWRIGYTYTHTEKTNKEDMRWRKQEIEKEKVKEKFQEDCFERRKKEKDKSSNTTSSVWTTKMENWRRDITRGKEVTDLL